MMRHLLLLPLMLGIASPTYADLGPADTSPQAEEPNQTKFDAWCVEKYADCVVRLEGNLLSVDDSAGITAKQLIHWSRSDEYRSPAGWFNFIGPHHLYKYNFTYEDNLGKVKIATIVFQNSKYSDSFYSLIRSWVNSKENSTCRYNFDTRKESC